MTWTTSKELKAKLLKMWDNGKLLRSEQQPEVLFPLSLKLKGPTSTELSTRFAEASTWIQNLKKDSLRLTWHKTNHRIIGTNELPTHAIFSNVEEICRFIKRTKELEIYRSLLKQTKSRCPELAGWIFRHPIQALQLGEVWGHLLDIVAWLYSNQQPNIYLRQVDLPGVDTKFFERHKGVLAELFELALPDAAAKTVGGSFEQRFGFRSRPTLVRWRPLADNACFRGFRELTVTKEDFAKTDPGYSKVLIVENEINFHAFPPLKDAIIVFGSGYKVGALKDVPWLASRKIYYWGDIDTHGFTILNQFRGSYPQTTSILMDRSTFLAHKDRWVSEAKQTKAALPNLTPNEQSLYQALLLEEYGASLRLEQELIRYGLVQEAASWISSSDCDTNPA